ncbi:MAG TPA: DUF2007 domain-containing protein [Thermoanaerobaculia bacterium]|nr:DUF2007 domain-containing protein [Thermoanaerobaculia bacterium]
MADSNQGYPDDVNTVPAEDGTTWVEIASTGTEDEAQLLRGFLEAEGIPAQVESLKFDQAPINFGNMGDIRVYVGSEDETRAQELLRKRQQEYERLDDDDETLVTDEGPATIDETAPVEGDDNA